MAYTVKQLADLAGVSVRTLHYYDEIDLLNPPEVGTNGYRYYDEAAVYRLQQILFFREMDLNLATIKRILDSPSFDQLHALESHRAALHGRVQRLNDLIQTIDRTIADLTGELTVKKQDLFQGFTEEQEQYYAQEAEKLYDPQEVKASYRQWNNYSAAQKDQIKAEGSAIYTDLAALIEQGPATPEDPAVQAMIARWHQHLRYFYEPSLERLLGLADLYNDSPDFAEKFQTMHPDLPAFMRRAIHVYVDGLRSA